jgi:hypothetical protein
MAEYKAAQDRIITGQTKSVELKDKELALTMKMREGYLDVINEMTTANDRVSAMIPDANRGMAALANISRDVGKSTVAGSMKYGITDDNDFGTGNAGGTGYHKGGLRGAANATPAFQRMPWIMEQAGTTGVGPGTEAQLRMGEGYGGENQMGAGMPTNRGRANMPFANQAPNMGGWFNGGGIIPAFNTGAMVPSGTGGRITGQNIKPEAGGDNILAKVKSGEVILNSEQQARAGGSDFFASIGVPGFAGGYRPSDRSKAATSDMLAMRKKLEEGAKKQVREADAREWDEKKDSSKKARRGDRKAWSLNPSEIAYNLVQKFIDDDSGERRLEGYGAPIKMGPEFEKAKKARKTKEAANFKASNKKAHAGRIRNIADKWGEIGSRSYNQPSSRKSYEEYDEDQKMRHDPVQARINQRKKIDAEKQKYERQRDAGESYSDVRYETGSPDDFGNTRAATSSSIWDTPKDTRLSRRQKDLNAENFHNRTTRNSKYRKEVQEDNLMDEVFHRGDLLSKSRDDRMEKRMDPSWHAKNGAAAKRTREIRARINDENHLDKSGNLRSDDDIRERRGAAVLEQARRNREKYGSGDAENFRKKGLIEGVESAPSTGGSSGGGTNVSVNNLFINGKLRGVELSGSGDPLEELGRQVANG